jgi:hypothetical protein
VIVALRFSDAEPNDHLIQEGWVRQFNAGVSKILRSIEYQFVYA